MLEAGRVPKDILAVSSREQDLLTGSCAFYLSAVEFYFACRFIPTPQMPDRGIEFIGDSMMVGTGLAQPLSCTLSLGAQALLCMADLTGWSSYADRIRSSRHS